MKRREKICSFSAVVSVVSVAAIKTECIILQLNLLGSWVDICYFGRMHVCIIELSATNFWGKYISLYSTDFMRIIFSNIIIFSFYFILFYILEIWSKLTAMASLGDSWQTSWTRILSCNAILHAVGYWCRSWLFPK